MNKSGLLSEMRVMKHLMVDVSTYMNFADILDVDMASDAKTLFQMAKQVDKWIERLTAS